MSTRGNMKPAEIKPLVMAARKAFDIQADLGNLDAGETFDTWRHRQCQAAVSKPGITACNHADYRPLLAHFQTLSGDAAAFGNALDAGAPKDHSEAGDTHEKRRQLANEIADVLAAHEHLAGSTVDQLIAEGAQEWYAENPTSQFPGPDPKWLASIRSRKAAIEASGKGPITVGYLIWIVRQKTRRPDLTLGRDWQAALAERCTVAQLTQVLYTITNRIAAHEGRGRISTRNKSQRVRRPTESGTTTFVDCEPF